MYNLYIKTFKLNIFQMTNKQLNTFSKKIGLNTRFKNSNYITRNIFSLEEFENSKKQVRFAREFMLANIEFLKIIKSYRGSRHRKLLPVRGQRTHTNAKTNRKKYK